MERDTKSDPNINDVPHKVTALQAFTGYLSIYHVKMTMCCCCCCSCASILTGVVSIHID
jgi:hypothetical protein